MSNPMDKAAGKVKEAAGDLTGQDDLAKEGAAQQDKADAQEKAQQKQAEAQKAQAEAQKNAAEEKKA